MFDVIGGTLLDILVFIIRSFSFLKLAYLVPIKMSSSMLKNYLARAKLFSHSRFSSCLLSITYIHQNPVQEKWHLATNPEDYTYSSASL